MNDAEGRSAIRSLLKDCGELRGFCGELEFRDAIRAFFRSNGLVAPTDLVALYLLEQALWAAGKWLGEAIVDRFVSYCYGVPFLKAFMLRLVALREGGRERAQLKAWILEQLAEGTTPVGRVKPDINTDLDVLAKLHSDMKIDGLEASLGILISETNRVISEKLDNHWHPQIGWPLPIQPSNSILSRLSYLAEGFRLVGRDGDLDRLERELGGDVSLSTGKDRFRWMLVTGAGGEGKTRLAYEFARRLAARGWRAGLLPESELRGDFRPAAWRPDRSTLFVIDYPARQPENVRALLEALSQGAPRFDWPVRVLLMEREAHGRWHRDAIGKAAAGVVANHRATVGEAEMRLGALPPAAVAELMRDRFDAAGMAPPDDATLLADARAVDPRSTGDGPAPRALFAIAAAEWRIARTKSGAPGESVGEKPDRLSVLDDIIARERDKRWAATRRGSDDAVRAAHERALVLATMTLGLSFGEYERLRPGIGLRLLPEPEDLLPSASDLASEMGATQDGLRALQPDLLGEHFVLSFLDDSDAGDRDRPVANPKQRQAFIDAAFAAQGCDAPVFAQRCAKDFPDRVAELDWLAPSRGAPAEAHRQFARVVVELVRSFGSARDWDRTAALLGKLDACVMAHRDDPSLARSEARAALGVIEAAAAATNVEIVKRAFARFESLSGRVGPDAEIERAWFGALEAAADILLERSGEPWVTDLYKRRHTETENLLEKSRKNIVNQNLRQFDILNEFVGVRADSNSGTQPGFSSYAPASRSTGSRGSELADFVSLSGGNEVFPKLPDQPVGIGKNSRDMLSNILEIQERLLQDLARPDGSAPLLIRYQEMNNLIELIGSVHDRAERVISGDIKTTGAVVISAQSERTPILQRFAALRHLRDWLEDLIIMSPKEIEECLQAELDAFIFHARSEEKIQRCLLLFWAASRVASLYSLNSEIVHRGCALIGKCYIELAQADPERFASLAQPAAIAASICIDRSRRNAPEQLDAEALRVIAHAGKIHPTDREILAAKDRAASRLLPDFLWSSVRPIP